MKTKNRIYQLYELRDEIRKALINSKSVEDSERVLVAIINQSQEAEMFKDFTASISKNWPDYETQRTKLNTTLEKINYIISLH